MPQQDPVGESFADVETQLNMLTKTQRDQLGPTYKAIYRYLARTFPREVAAESTQEAIAKMLRIDKSIDNPVAFGKPTAYRIALHNWGRAKRIDLIDQEASFGPSDPTTTEDLEDSFIFDEAEIRAVASDFVRWLKPEEFDVLRGALMGKRSKQIAAEFECSEATVSRKLSFVKMMLRALILLVQDERRPDDKRSKLVQFEAIQREAKKRKRSKKTGPLSGPAKEVVERIVWMAHQARLRNYSGPSPTDMGCPP